MNMSPLNYRSPSVPEFAHNSELLLSTFRGRVLYKCLYFCAYSICRYILEVPFLFLRKSLYVVQLIRINKAT